MISRFGGGRGNRQTYTRINGLGRERRGWAVVVVRTVNNEDVSDHVNACMQLMKMDQCQRTGPFGWTDQPEKPLSLFPPKAGSRLTQCKLHPTPRRGKRLRGTPTSLPSPSEEGGRNLFHLLGVECPGSGSGMT